MKFSPTGYNDPAFAVAFLAHLVAVVCWIAYAASAGHYQARAPAEAAVALYRGEALATAEHGSSAGVALALTFGSICVSVVWSVIWLALLQLVPEQMVVLSLVFAPCMFAAMAAVFFAMGQILGGLLSLLCAAAFAVFAWYYWDRVDLTAQLFRSVSRTYQKAGGIFLVAFGSVLLQGIWMCVSGLALAPVGNGGFGLGLHFLLLVSFYWGFQVVTNVLYVTCGGICARYYYNEKVEGAVGSSLRQAATNYFGSICLGSLLIAVIQALRAMCEMAKDQARESENGGAVVLLLVADCVLGCLKSLARFFNSYVFAYIAVFGHTFSEASSKVLELLTDSDAQCLLNYSLVGVVSCFALFAAGLLNACVTALLAWRLGLAGGALGLAAAGGFLVGLAVMSVVCNVVSAGVQTLFVCWAESQSLLEGFDKDLAETVGQYLGPAKERLRLAASKAS